MQKRMPADLLCTATNLAARLPTIPIDSLIWLLLGELASKAIPCRVTAGPHIGEAEQRLLFTDFADTEQGNVVLLIGRPGPAMPTSLHTACKEPVR